MLVAVATAEATVPRQKFGTLDTSKIHQSVQNLCHPTVDFEGSVLHPFP